MSVIQMKWAHSVKVGNQTAKQLLCFLASHNFNHPALKFKNATMATILEVKERAIQDAKTLLIAKGLITVNPRFNENGKQLSSETILNVPPQYVDGYMSELEEGCSRDTPRGAAGTPQGCSRNTLPPPKNDPQHVVNLVKIPVKKIPNSNSSNSNLNKREGSPVDNFLPDMENRSFALSLGIDIETETKSFLERHKWKKTQNEFRNWLIMAYEYKTRKTMQASRPNYNENNQTRCTVPEYGPGHPAWEIKYGDLK